MSKQTHTLHYGTSGCLQLTIPSECLVGVHQPPPPLTNLGESLATALQTPLDSPPLDRMVVPGDRVVIALDRNTPASAELMLGLWQMIERCGVTADCVTILQPASIRVIPTVDPRQLLPAKVRSEVHWKIHDPTEKAACAYLASTASNERIYLATPLVEADLVICVGAIMYDSLLGHRGTSSVLYPGLSSADAFRKAFGQGHDELEPEDSRPLRQVTDEIAWLLGTQFCVQVLPSGGTGVAAVWAGQIDAVFRAGKAQLKQVWRLRLKERPEMVIAAIEADDSGHGWPQLGAAVEAARHLVARDGRIVLLTELDCELTEGLRWLQRGLSPKEVLKPLREASPLDWQAATQLARALEWANVHLLSRHPVETTESLFLTPIASPAEVARLTTGSDVPTCVLLGGAQFCNCRVMKVEK